MYNQTTLQKISFMDRVRATINRTLMRLNYKEFDYGQDDCVRIYRIGLHVQVQYLARNEQWQDWDYDAFQFRYGRAPKEAIDLIRAHAPEALKKHKRMLGA